MRWRTRVAKFFGLWRRAHLAQDLAAEIAAHLELEIEENMAAGMSRQEARRAALRSFGNVALAKEDSRRVWQFPAIETLLEDAHYGLRLLRKNPGFAATAVLTLALGIGTNTAICNLLYAAIVRPLPYNDAVRLVWVTQYAPHLQDFIVPGPTFLSWRAHNTVFADMAAYVDHYCDGNLVSGQEPVRLDRCAEVSANFLDLLGVRPVLGRGFRAQEDQPGSGHVILLSYSYWQGRFGANPEIVGKLLSLDGRDYAVAGVLPKDFRYPGGFRPDALTPLVLAPGFDSELWNNGGVNVIAHLRPSISKEAARANLQSLTGNIARTYPAALSGQLINADVRVVPLPEQLVGNFRSILLVLFGAAGLVLLVCCVNVANLLLARGVARRRELGVRAALGAGQGRIVRQLLTEGCVLALLGGVLAWGFAEATMLLVRAFVPENLAGFAQLHLNGSVFLFMLALSLLVGVLFSLAPAALLSQSALAEAIKSGGNALIQKTASIGLRAALVSAELGLSLVLLVGSGLLLRSLLHLLSVSPGFNPEGVLTLQVTRTPDRHIAPSANRAFFETLLGGIRALPGVARAGGTSDLPFYYGISYRTKVQIEGTSGGTGGELNALVSVPVSGVTPGYFEAMQIPLEAGRPFRESDDAGAERVAMVTRAFARENFPGASPVGRHIRFSRRATDPEEDFKIIGVVGDIRFLSLERSAAAVIFTSLLQYPDEAMTLAVRTVADPEKLLPGIRREVQKLDRSQPIYHIATMEQRVADSLSGRRFDAWLCGIFAVLAMVLAAIGVYGVVSYWVTQRTHEIGVRLALGARSSHILRLVGQQSAKLALGGIAAGLAASYGVGRLMAALLYATAPADFFTFAVSPLMLLLVSGLAVCIPALRAVRVEPMQALRYE